MTAYRAFLGETLVTMPGVRETRTYAMLEEVKATTALPIRAAEQAVVHGRQEQGQRLYAAP